jgi:hypothetical protein
MKVELSPALHPYIEVEERVLLSSPIVFINLNDTCNCRKLKKHVCLILYY